MTIKTVKSVKTITAIAFIAVIEYITSISSTTAINKETIHKSVTTAKNGQIATGAGKPEPL